MIRFTFHKIVFSCILALSLGLAGCEKEQNGEEKPADKHQYLTGVTSERQIKKDALSLFVNNYIHELGISTEQISPYLIDLELATLTYRTTNVDGSVVEASGLIAYPTGTTEYNHLLSIQHGTMDMEEAPSKQVFPVEMAPALAGQVTVMADYLGYGVSQTANRQHPYLHLRSTGTACSDMVEAAREYLADKGIAEVKDSLVLMGYSQGGTSTVATVLELEQRGQAHRISQVHAGGGLYDLQSSLDAFVARGNTPYSRSGYIPYLIRGIAYGEQLHLEDSNLYASQVIKKGTNRLFSTQPLSKWHEALGTDLTQVLHPDFYRLETDSANVNADIKLLVAAMLRNSLFCHTMPTVPITFYHSPNDDYVPYVNAKRIHEEWPNSTLIDLKAPDHFNGGIEFMLRLMGLGGLL